MRRTVLGLDRIVAVLLGLILLAAGLTTAAWYNGTLRQLLPQTPRQLSTDRAADLTGTGWWPWATSGIGVLLVVLGMWWLLAHLPRRSTGLLTLPGSDRTGKLQVDPSGPAATAAEILAETPGIRAVHSKVIRDRGQLVVTLDATVDPRADLAPIIAATDAIAADLNTVLGRDDAHARVQLAVTRRPRKQPRVH